ncbi:hypothetical protein FVEN_g12798 [Fusarium venenatum]|nr:hypothetical protein FVEN_g12798 [Fusarium venenatum]
MYIREQSDKMGSMQSCSQPAVIESVFIPRAMAMSTMAV